MQITNYQDRTKLTAVYPHSDTGRWEAFIYLFMGLAGESAEVLNKAKKVIRGDKFSAEVMPEIREELGDVMWYVAQICNEAGWDLEEILDENWAKLNSRKRRGKLRGDGDHR